MASALTYINTGSFRATAKSEQSYRNQVKMQKQLEPANRRLENNHFNGMFKEDIK